MSGWQVAAPGTGVSIRHLQDNFTFGAKVGIISDVHGENRTLVRALAHCRDTGVDTIALLGDLFDLVEEADRCAIALESWPVIGVYGNHEREMVLDAAAGRIEVKDETLQLLRSLRDRIITEDACLIHEQEQWGYHDPVARMFQPGSAGNGHTPAAWITFAGHTHVRAARTESGPLDISRGRVKLTMLRNYLINPGALSIGQYAIWDRETHEVHFHQLEDR